MKQNLSAADRIIRVVLAAAILSLVFLDTITGIAGLVMLVLALIFAMTAVFGYCPLYAAFKISSLQSGRDTRH